MVKLNDNIIVTNLVKVMSLIWYCDISGQRCELTSDNIFELEMTRIITPTGEDNVTCKHVYLWGKLVYLIEKIHEWIKINVINNDSGIYLRIKCKTDSYDYKLSNFELGNFHYIITPKGDKIYFSSNSLKDLNLKKKPDGTIKGKYIGHYDNLSNLFNSQISWNMRVRHCTGNGKPTLYIQYQDFLSQTLTYQREIFESEKFRYFVNTNLMD